MGLRQQLRRIMLWTTALGTALVLSLAGLTAVQAQSDPNARDCDANAVIMCGALSTDELKSKYAENQGGNVQALYSQFGIPSSAALDGMVEGSVSAATNQVMVGSTVVGTNAITAGRQDISNSRGSSTPIMGGAFFQRSPSVSFADPSGSLRAFVKMDANNRFQFAVLTSCGNPVKATPNQPVPPPTPTFSVRKEVRQKGQEMWMNSIKVAPGDHVEFRISILNTSQTDLQNVRVTDTLPSAFTTTDLSLENSANPPKPELFGNGVAIGTVRPGIPAQIVFEAVANQTDDSACTTGLQNTATVTPSNAPPQQARATIFICAPPPPPAPQPTPTPPPAPVQHTLPNTGPGGLLAVFSLLSAGGFLLHRYFIFWKRIV